MGLEIFNLFSFLGTIAFAASGATIAIEEKYDILGVFVLGLVTSFGGGVLRNILIEAPTTMLWDQKFFITTALITCLSVFLLPKSIVIKWKKIEVFLDAIGLAAFSIQGSLVAISINMSLPAIIVSAMLTGVGGGIIRDLLAGRKPLVLKDEIYALWSIIGGLMMGLQIVYSITGYLILFFLIITFRMISLKFDWKLPKKK